MKSLKILLYILLFQTFANPLLCQENTLLPQRTPEQEAIKQTEKLQQELNLTTDQTKLVYEINLRYARERQISNTRSEAVERMKNKNVDIQRILNDEQNDRLQSKRYERPANETSPENRNQPVNSSTFRSTSGFRANPIVRVPVDVNVRSGFRPTTPTQNTTPNTQTLPRNTEQPIQSTRSASPSSTRSAVISAPTLVPRRTESPSRR